MTPLKPTVAAVLPGGGARGAYEVGALSVLLPALEERGERVSLWCGTSVGAINAVAFASLNDRSAAEQSAEATLMWTRMRKHDVVSPLVGLGGMRTLARAVSGTLGLPSLGVASLLDPSPMAQNINRWINWSALEANIESEVVRAACVVATSVTTGEPVAFVASKRPQRQLVDDQIRYVQTRLTGEHVRASAAIPVLFPTVEITTPRGARGHYADGGTRLNSPIKPAVQLGAERVIVIGFEPFNAGAAKPLAPRKPNLADVASNILDGLLVDQVAQDLRRLAMINSFFVEDAITGTLRSPRAYRLARGQAPYRPISYALVAPRRRGEIGRLAQDVFKRRYSGLRGLRDPDYLVISRALGGDTRARGELLSFLLFDPEFTQALIELGRRDAARWLRRHPRFWCREASHDLAVGEVDRKLLNEQDTLQEFRSHRHRN